MSTGMSIQKEINKAYNYLNPNVIMHTNSVYPTPIEDLNLLYISYLRSIFPDYTKEIGYSSHYYGLVDVYCAIALGAKWIEKHICLSHQDWGSDQLSSVEPHGLIKMVKAVRDIEKALSKGDCQRTLFPGEEIKRESLRGI